MSQERTRFPIQPKDVRRSAQSNKDMQVHGHGGPNTGNAQSDKPNVPPHLRGRDETPQDKPELEDKLQQQDEPEQED